MKYHRRPYSGYGDKYDMAALARKYSSETLHVIDLPYRLSSWALDEVNNIGLWFDGEEKLAGWAVLQTPFWTIDIVCHPAAALHQEILAWADRRAQQAAGSPYGHPAWYVMAFEDEEERIHDLERAGFQCQSDVGENSWSKAWMRRESSLPVKVYQPPAGYIVRSLAGEAEVDAYVELHRSVFESKNMTSDWRRRVLQHPAYRKDLDIVVETPDGRLAAFCICWFDDSSSTGQIEPLGCHKDFRKYALGRVALSDGLHRLQSLGAKNFLSKRTVIAIQHSGCMNSSTSRLFEMFWYIGKITKEDAQTWVTICEATKSPDRIRRFF